MNAVEHELFTLFFLLFILYEIFYEVYIMYTCIPHKTNHSFIYTFSSKNFIFCVCFVLVFVFPKNVFYKSKNENDTIKFVRRTKSVSERKSV